MKVTIHETGEEITVYSTPELSAELAAHRDRECKHSTQELRRRKTSNGGYQVKMHCLECGKRMGNSQPQSPDDENIPFADISIETEHESARTREYSGIWLHHGRLQWERENSWWAEYKVYLQSDAWAAKRQRVLQRAKFVCEGCLEQPAAEVHHLTYDHKMNEFLFELVAVCTSCHRRLHDSFGHVGEMDRDDDSKFWDME